MLARACGFCYSRPTSHVVFKALEKVAVKRGESRAEILAIIPARGASKGIPRKNIKDLGGKPLVAYTIETALAAVNIHRVVVSTDDEEIAEISRAFGAEVPFLRPCELAGDASPLHEATRFTLKELNNREGYCPDAIVLMYPTTPFRKTETIEFLVSKLMSGYGSVVAYSAITQPPLSYLYRGDDGRLRKLHDSGFDPEDNKYVRILGYMHGRAQVQNEYVFAEYAHCLTDPRETIDLDIPRDFFFAREIVANNLYPF